MGIFKLTIIEKDFKKTRIRMKMEMKVNIKISGIKF